jgi:hypothetical protein
MKFRAFYRVILFGTKAKQHSWSFALFDNVPVMSKSQLLIPLSSSSIVAANHVALHSRRPPFHVYASWQIATEIVHQAETEQKSPGLE